MATGAHGNGWPPAQAAAIRDEPVWLADERSCHDEPDGGAGQD